MLDMQSRLETLIKLYKIKIVFLFYKKNEIYLKVSIYIKDE